MKSPWRFFIIVESLLGLLAVYQILTTPMIFLLIFGIFMLSLYGKNRKKGSSNNVLLIIGCLAIFFALCYSPAIWIMAVFAIIFVGLKGVELSGVDFAKRANWQKKAMVIVDTAEPESHNGQKQKQQLFGSERVGSHVYEWDDINLTIASGDTLIDLGNTILPKRDNVIVIRKGVGRTRILVPAGIGVMLDHSTIAGNVKFLGETSQLKNETFKIYSEDFDDSARRVKIVTNTLLGDIEVIRV